MVERASRRIQDRVKQIADCVKGLSSPPYFSTCSIAQVVEEVIKTLQLIAQEKGVTIQSSGLELLPPILADEGLLFNAFYNLVNNAIPEVHAGGCVTIAGTLQRDRQAVLLSVADTGRGMPPDVRDSLFTSGAISRKKGGTGLGTKIVKDAIDLHGGAIWVESKEGRGTTFHILLPLQQAGRTPCMTP
jgi:signal transduction histidine kinase